MNIILLLETGKFRDLPHLFHFVELIIIGIAILHCRPNEVDLICIPQYRDDKWKGKDKPHNEWIVTKMFPNATVVHETHVIDKNAKLTVVDRAKCDHGRINKAYLKYIKLFDSWKWFHMVDLKVNRVNKPVVTYIDRQFASRRKLPNTVHEKIVSTLVNAPDIEFQHVQMEHMEFEDQVRVAQRTDVLIGVHGNGLTHTMFMKPNGFVCEIFVPGISFQWDYYTLSKMMGHEYMCIFDGRLRAPYLFNNQNKVCTSVDVDPVWLHGMIKQAIEEYPL